MNFYCHVCGFDQGVDAPWGESGLDPSFTICDCCGVEYGYEDCTSTGVAKYRSEWLASGSKWQNPKARPFQWSLATQLQQIPAKLPAGIKQPA